MSFRFHHVMRIQKIHNCYLSADKTTYALLVKDNNETRFYVMSAVTDENVFCITDEKVTKELHDELELHQIFDFSPNSKKIVIALRKSIYVYNLETRSLAYSTDLFAGKIRFIKFLDDERLVYLDEKLNVLRFENLTETQNEIGRELTSEFDLFFLNRKEKNILCISSRYNKENPGPSSTRTKLLSLDGKVSPGPVFDYIRPKFKFWSMHNSLFHLFDYDPDMGAVYMDFSDYLHDGQISYGCDIHKFWNIAGVPTLPIEICRTLFLPKFEVCGKRIEGDIFYRGPNYLFMTPDKIFTDLRDENENHVLEYMSRRDFNYAKLAEVICCGLALGGTSWNKFLTRGLYDPRLFLFIGVFCGD